NQSTAQYMDCDSVDWSRQSPATGPVFVRGLSAGDVLKATIEKIELDGRGLVTVGPQGGVMRDYIEERHVKFFDLDTENNTTEFNGMTVPLNPMIGAIGNAPAACPVPNSTPGAHGGNMDCRKMTEGAVLISRFSMMVRCSDSVMFTQRWVTAKSASAAWRRLPE